MLDYVPVAPVAKKSVCCICHSTFNGWGHDPYPVSKIKSDTCCTQCYPAVIARQALDVLQRPL